MKIRTDFVSNSSSSSFIVSINKQYKLKDFVKDLAKACSNPMYTYHDKDIVNRNRRILDFCLNTYELAFLGAWKLRVDEKVYTKQDFYDIFTCHADYDLSDNEKEIFLKEADEHWKYELECIEKAKKPTCDPIFKRMVERNYLDQDGKLHIFHDVYAGNCVIDSDRMRYDFNRYSTRNDETEYAIKCRVKNLKKLAEENADYENGKLFGLSHVRCYAITLNTIKNTRDILKAGYCLEFEYCPNLDALEKRLKEGQQIFNIHIGHSGEGYGNFEIYCEADANGIDDVAAEIIGSESM